MDPQQPMPPRMPSQPPVMPPEQPAPTTPPEQPVFTTPPEAPRKSHRKTVGIWLLVSPTALIILAILVYAIINFVVNSSAPTDSSDLFGDRPVITPVINIIVFLLSTIGILAWLPCLIIGIVLLATQKK